MSLDLDHTADRLERIERELTDTKRAAATMGKSDRLLASQLIRQLDAMLRELTPLTATNRATVNKRK